jgi:uncharacterized Fe-S cluster-containing radical SAM superfamily protein
MNKFIKNRKINYSGIMTSYVCSASCRHCMFCSSPKAGKDFITEEAAGRITRTLAREGVTSVHIGGGEPFLNFAALTGLLEAMRNNGVGVDYIETNAFWCRDEKTVYERLASVRALGVRTVMVSVDPFHAEYIPLNRPLLLIRLLRETGMDYFVWQERFISRLRRLDPSRTHTHAELKSLLGDDYVAETAREYGLGMNGRALTIAGQLYPRRPAAAFLTRDPCRLLDGGHCHIDLYENFIPSGCPGISVALDDYFGGALSEEKYPVVTRLLRGGIAALYEYSVSHGFTPSADGYVTKCELCFFVRDYLRSAKPSYDIAPDCFYNAMNDAFKEATVEPL